jgi:hypothetical protein
MALVLQETAETPAYRYEVPAVDEVLLVIGKTGNTSAKEQTVGRVLLAEGDYNLTVAALGNLGVRTEGVFPEYDELIEQLTPETRSFMAAQALRGDLPELTVRVPFIKYQAERLLANFDRGCEQQWPVYGKLARYLGRRLLPRSGAAYFEKTTSSQSYIHTKLWDKFLFDRDERTAQLEPVMALMDTTDPLDRSTAANASNEAGLVYVSRTVLNQRSRMADDFDAAAKAGIQLDFMGPAEWLVLQAKRQECGLPLLDRHTTTRFVQYGAETEAGPLVQKIHFSVDKIPNASADGVRLRLRGSNTNSICSFDHEGVRRVLKI